MNEKTIMPAITVRDILELIPAGRMALIERDAVQGVDIGGAPVYCMFSDVNGILRSGADLLDYPVGEDSLEAGCGHVRIVAHPTDAQIEALRRAAMAG